MDGQQRLEDADSLISERQRAMGLIQHWKRRRTMKCLADIHVHVLYLAGCLFVAQPADREQNIALGKLTQHMNPLEIYNGRCGIAHKETLSKSIINTVGLAEMLHISDNVVL